jgi:hypothetical protein
MVRRSPMDVNPTDLRKGSFLQDLLSNKLRPESRGRGVRGIDEMLQEVAPNLSRSPSSGREIEMPSSPQQFGDARKLNNQGIDFRQIGAELAELAQAEAESSPGANSQIDNMITDLGQPVNQEAPIQDFDWDTFAEDLSRFETPNQESQSPGLWNSIKDSYNAHPYRGDLSKGSQVPGLVDQIKDSYNEYIGKYPDESKNSQSTPFLSEDSPYIQTAPQWMKDIADYMTPNKAGIPSPTSKEKPGLAAADKAQNLLEGANVRSITRPKAGLSDSIEAVPDIQDVEPETSVGYFPEEIASVDNVKTNIISPEDIKQLPPEQLQPQPGAVEAIKQNPQLLAEIERLTGGSIPKELLEKASDYEKALTDTGAEIDQNIADIRKRIQENKLTTQDNILLGIAVLAPALIAAITGGGAEEILGTFAPVSEVLMGLQKDRSKNEREDLDRISELELKKADLAEKGAKYKKDLINNLPGKALKERLGDRPMRQFGNDIGIQTGKNSPIWIDSSAIYTKEDVDHLMKNVIPEANIDVGNAESANLLIDKSLDVINQLGDQGLLKQAYSTVLQRDGTPIIIKDEFGEREVNGPSQLKFFLEKLTDHYNKSMKNRALTSNVVDHWSGLIKNPYTLEGLKSTDLNSLREQLLNMKDMINSGVINSYSKQGVLREPLEQVLNVRKVQYSPSESNRSKAQSKKDSAMWANQNIDELKKKIK